MTDNEMRRIAKMQADFLVASIKEDDELLDLMFPPRCMNIEEAAEFIRMPISTLYTKVNEIPHEKVGKRLVFTDRGLMRWMRRSGRQVSEKPIEIPLKQAM